MHSAKIPVIPRINSIESGLFLDDLKAVIGPYISAISIGKINSPDDIKYIDSAILELENYEIGTVEIYFAHAIKYLNSAQSTTGLLKIKGLPVTPDESLTYL